MKPTLNEGKVMPKLLYRYEIEYKNEDGDTDIILREFPVVRETERTYFINHFGKSKLKRISKDGDEYGFNVYAFANKKNAKRHFIRRTNKRIIWFKYWTEECKKGLELIESKVGEDE